MLWPLLSGNPTLHLKACAVALSLARHFAVGSSAAEIWQTGQRQPAELEQYWPALLHCSQGCCCCCFLAAQDIGMAAGCSLHYPFLSAEKAVLRLCPHGWRQAAEAAEVMPAEHCRTRFQTAWLQWPAQLRWPAFAPHAQLTTGNQRQTAGC